jgi:hypothetical protein
VATLILLAAVVALAAVVVWQNRHRLPSRGHQAPPATLPEECEVCGARKADNVTVGAVTERAGMGGWSGITATWCLEHCPEEHLPAP